MSVQPKTVIVVDDEPAARLQLRDVIESFTELRIVAEIGDGRLAIEAIETHQPDIVFLDIDMPEIDGFAVARATEHLQYQLVFVTAHHKYALPAFDTHAIDYVLKPVRPAALEKCIHKMLRQQAIVHTATDSAQRANDSLLLSDGDARRVIAHDYILYVEGLGRYRRLHLSQAGAALHGQDTILSNTTLERFDDQLQQGPFMRVHRGYIISLKKVVALRVKARRHYLVLEEVADPIPVARSRLKPLKSLLDSR